MERTHRSPGLGLGLALSLAAATGCGRPPTEPPAAAPPAPAPAARPAAAPPPPVAAAAAVVPSSFTCAGGDPPWSLRVSARGGHLRLPEGESRFDGPLRATATGAYTWLGAPPPGPGSDPDATLALLVVPGHCFPSDGTAARPFSAQLSLPDGRQASGCCTPGD